MKLMVSTNVECGRAMLYGKYNSLVWASDNMETVAHYYEGCVLEIDIAIDRKLHIGYASCEGDIKLYGIRPEEYTYGMKSGMKYPPNAKWYSFSAKYVREHLKGIREIHPDLSAWQEEE